ncbi:hypothetical protein TYRP_003542 [Tyrophagus putrescentiae]|nr:hypothetical protein TYRP_003542 [Tyrophagus putrescentiae]
MGSIAEEMLLLLLYTGRNVSVPDVDLFPLLLPFLLLASSFGGHCRRHHCESVISGRIWLQIWPTGGLMASSRRWEPQIEWSDQVSVDTASSAFLIRCRRHHGWHLIFPGAVAGSETARGFLCPAEASVRSSAEEMLLLLLLYTGRSVFVPNVNIFLLLLLAFLFGGCRRHHHWKLVISGRIWPQIWSTGGLMASSRCWEPQIGPEAGPCRPAQCFLCPAGTLVRYRSVAVSPLTISVRELIFS